MSDKTLRYDDEATLQAAWRVLMRAAIQMGRLRQIAPPEVKAAFEAGWHAHKDAMAKVAKLKGTP